jgi:hypothetical protein
MLVTNTVLLCFAVYRTAAAQQSVVLAVARRALLEQEVSCYSLITFTSIQWLLRLLLFHLGHTITPPRFCLLIAILVRCRCIQLLLNRHQNSCTSLLNKGLCSMRSRRSHSTNNTNNSTSDTTSYWYCYCSVW